MPLGMVFTVDRESRVYYCESADSYEDTRLSRPELTPEAPVRAYCRWWAYPDGNMKVEWFLPHYPPTPKQERAAKDHVHRVIASEEKLRAWLARAPGQWPHILLHRPKLADVMPHGREALAVIDLARQAVAPHADHEPCSEEDVIAAIRGMGYEPCPVGPDYAMALFMSRALGRERLKWCAGHDDARDPEGLTAYAVFLAAGFLAEIERFPQDLELASDAADCLYARVCRPEDARHGERLDGLMRLWSMGIWPIAPHGHRLCYYRLRGEASG